MGLGFGGFGFRGFGSVCDVRLVHGRSGRGGMEWVRVFLGGLGIWVEKVVGRVVRW
jgi:hypothetical protein